MTDIDMEIYRELPMVIRIAACYSRFGAECYGYVDDGNER